MLIVVAAAYTFPYQVDSVTQRGIAHPEDYGAFYSIRCDAAWSVRHALVEAAGGGRLELYADGEGHWQDSEGAPVEALAGTVERVTFHSPETGFCVLKVQARGRRDLVPVVGHAPAIAAGEWVTATGS